MVLKIVQCSEVYVSFLSQRNRGFLNKRNLFSSEKLSLFHFCRITFFPFFYAVHKLYDKRNEPKVKEQQKRICIVENKTITHRQLLSLW